MSSLGLNATGAAIDAIDVHVPTLVSDRFASRLGSQDPTLWGPAAEPEAAQRLGWVDPFAVSRELVPGIIRLRDQFRSEGITRVVIAGMGGSSLAPEVISGHAGVPLTVLDSTDPEMIGNVLAAGVTETVVVVSSKSGSTVETDSQRRAFEQAFKDAGIQPGQRMVAVTDPGSPLEQLAFETGYRAVFNADPQVGGRYSALTAYGLVPSGLAGVDIDRLLEDAEEAIDVLLVDEDDNIGLRLGACLAGTSPLRDKLIFSVLDSRLPGFGDWAEQLIAESTGKNNTGLLPVVVEPEDPETTNDAEDLLQIQVIPDEHFGDPSQLELFDASELDSDVVPPTHGVQVYGTLGAQLLLWEFATAVASRLLGVNPFDQPDVESAKIAARTLLDETPEPATAQARLQNIELFGPAVVTESAHGEPAGTVAALADVFTATLEQIPDRGYLAVQAYLDESSNAEIARLRELLAAATHRPVTFGWGPRFLHSTGQFHKGGPATGVFLQVTGDTYAEIQVPERAFTFGELITAQAAGDADVLSQHGLTVVRLHLQDRETGIEQLLEAAQRISRP